MESGKANRPAMDENETERQWLEGVLTGDIPLGGAMELTVSRIDDEGVMLDLPLAANINDKGTAFGGAMASAMIMAGWSLPRLLLERSGLRADLVIGRCEMRFLVPVSGDYQAYCPWPDAGECQQFVYKLRNSARAGLTLHPEIRSGGQVAATLSARYAALGQPGRKDQ